ncbi:MAG TPA: hypothetical protein VK579_09745 [Terriglobales bacterium]|nr:hypothetical protein [Terriglobales bacterium]
MLTHMANGFSGLACHTLSEFQEICACGGWQRLFADPLDKAQTDFLLKSAYLKTYGGLRETKTPRCRGKTSPSDYRLKRLEVVQFHSVHT